MVDGDLHLSKGAAVDLAISEASRRERKFFEEVREGEPVSPAEVAEYVGYLRKRYKKYIAKTDPLGPESWEWEAFERDLIEKVQVLSKLPVDQIRELITNMKDPGRMNRPKDSREILWGNRARFTIDSDALAKLPKGFRSLFGLKDFFNYYPENKAGGRFFFIQPVFYEEKVRIVVPDQNSRLFETDSPLFFWVFYVFELLSMQDIKFSI
ncbi:unnamed protein product [Amoebophrya sp. A25]|nr:unnamed protein product [Amoebophrya sp. A25]|eukprot:GSA25T00024775001.1